MYVFLFPFFFFFYFLQHRHRQCTLSRRGVRKWFVYGICPWGGRRGTELALGKAKEIIADIGEACTCAVLALRPKMSITDFDALVLDAGTMGSHIQAELSTKLDSMWTEFPLLLLGFFGE